MKQRFKQTSMNIFCFHVELASFKRGFTTTVTIILAYGQIRVRFLNHESVIPRAEMYRNTDGKTWTVLTSITLW
jgi:hypothetical protein